MGIRDDPGFDRLASSGNRCLEAADRPREGSNATVACNGSRGIGHNPSACLGQSAAAVPIIVGVGCGISADAIGAPGTHYGSYACAVPGSTNSATVGAAAGALA